jgi:hyaluronan synthase
MTRSSSSSSLNTELGYDSIRTVSSNRTISLDGRIRISKKGWLIRILTFAFLSLLIVVYNLFGLRNPQEEPIMMYTGFVISLSLFILTFGWIFYRNPSASSTIPVVASTITAAATANASITIEKNTYTASRNESANRSTTRRRFSDLISVIIPVYNQKKMIEIVIDAVSNSTFKNIEIIAVNDGSTDGTAEILDTLKNKYSHLKVIHKKNGGKRKAVATGFFKSKGEYVVLIDSDSVIDKHAIEEFVKTFDQNDRIGAIVGHVRLWNSGENFLTKCQDAWYDYEFNIYKTSESYFGAVTCCCGCLAAYRRKAIESFISFWRDDDDCCTTPLAPSLRPLSKSKLMESLASYDDSEDRALTAYSLKTWKTAYVPSAVVYTDVPEKFDGFIKQQKRWKKGYIRANLFVSTFFWRQNNPIISLIFYAGFVMAFLSPIITVAALFYSIFMYHHPWSPLFLIGGYASIGFFEGLDYKMRIPNAKYWIYKPMMNLILPFIVSWLVFYAIVKYNKNEWLTR